MEQLSIEEKKLITNSSIAGLDLNSFLSFVENTKNTQAVFDMQKELIRSPNRLAALGPMMESLQSNKDFLNLYKNKYIKRFPTTAELLEMPLESLGHCVGLHLSKNNINLDFAGIDVDVFYNQDFSLPVYLGIRALRNHDVLHAILGQDISPVGEYFLFGFQIAQFQSPLHVMSLAAGMLNSILVDIKNPSEIVGAISSGFLMGQKAKFVFAYPIEDNWHLPMSEVRKSLNIFV